jgi:hypothetical protein
VRQANISGSSIIRLAKEQVSSDVQGEVVILNFQSGVYYGLDAVGTRIWSLIQDSRRVSEIRDALVEEYDVEPERCECDLLALLQRLAGEGLIEVADEAVA